MFPVKPLTPLSGCPHYTRIRRGSIFVCAICHKSGFDHLQFFRPSPDDPQPDPKPKTKPAGIAVVAGAKETRRQRRQRIFGA
jgi:hypothetical protein